MASRRPSAGSGVMKCVEDVCGLYRVPFYRMQSRVIDVVQKDARGSRPMVIGKWRDRFGETHTGGMPDFLLTPAINRGVYEDGHPPGSIPVPFRPRIALWVECKEGPNAKLSPEQRAFRDDQEALGGHWLLVHDGPEALIEWFKQRGVCA